MKKLIKPPTIKQLLAEAKKLAMERGMNASTVYENAEATSSMIQIEIWNAPSKAQALRCLIAALREVPVVKEESMSVSCLQGCAYECKSGCLVTWINGVPVTRHITLCPYRFDDHHHAHGCPRVVPVNGRKK